LRSGKGLNFWETNEANPSTVVLLSAYTAGGRRLAAVSESQPLLCHTVGLFVESKISACIHTIRLEKFYPDCYAEWWTRYGHLKRGHAASHYSNTHFSQIKLSVLQHYSRICSCMIKTWQMAPHGPKWTVEMFFTGHKGVRTIFDHVTTF